MDGEAALAVPLWDGLSDEEREAVDARGEYKTPKGTFMVSTRHSPLATRHPPSAIRHPPSAIRHPPSAPSHATPALQMLRETYPIKGEKVWK